MKAEKMVIIDGNSLMNRAFYAIPSLTDSKGECTNAVYGFTNMLLRIISEEKPEYMAVAFDRKAPTFRHKAYTEYKAGRKKMPPELNSQFPIIKKVLKAFNIGIYEIDGYEADDIIGTVAKKCEKELDVTIYTGDRDALQLISDHTKVAITKRGITDIDIYDSDKMMDKYNATPRQFIDIKGLMGDASDNIPGVPGIGEKTAIRLIDEFKSIEGILENIDTIKSAKIKKLMIEYAEQALFSKKLATIVTDVPIEFNINEMRLKEADRQNLLSVFRELEFKSLIEKMELNKGTSSENLSAVDCKIADRKDIEELIQDVKRSKRFSIVFIIRGTDFYNTDIEGIGMSNDGNSALFIKPDHEYIEMLKDILEDENIKKYSHNAKDGYVSLNKHGIDLKGLEFDTAIASYLLNPSESTYNIDELLRRFLNIDIKPEKEIQKEIKDGADRSIICSYLCTEAAGVFKLTDILKKKISESGMDFLYYNIENPLIEVLASMEITGFKVDKNILLKLSDEFGSEIDQLTADIYKMSGEEFNINSPKQLGHILFDKLKLPVIKKTKTGYSTDAEVLEKLAPQNEIVKKLLDYRQIMKLKSTYVDGLLHIVNEDGRIHSSFNQTVTATGRISSTEPNLQNIPVRLEIGKRIRKVFIPSNDECRILSGDYSQIELRVLAHISKDRNLMDAFYNGLDIHRKTASEVFGVPMDEVTSTMRSRAKAVNFGIIYGISDFGLAKDIGISRKEAKTYIDNYLNKYSGVKSYMEGIVKKAKKDGFVTTILNRRRFIPEIKSSNYTVRSFGERLAMNTPIQGSAADIIKIAMVKVYYRLKERGLKSKLILQVHDELIVDVYKDELDAVKEIIKDSMENAFKLDVPLKVDINSGNNWMEAK